MKKTGLLRQLFGLFTAIALIQSLSAQTRTPTKEEVEKRSNEQSVAKDDEAVVLSPFVVNSEKDTGYAATSTLAGTRLNTPIKDLAASISIYTKDFMNDLGVTNASELLVYATGMEAAGPGGNFSGSASDISVERPDGESVRNDPQASTRTRGLAAPTFTRGYFPTKIAFDSYNTGTVTVNRGPNSALFGVGSPAGVVDTALLTADLNKDISTVSVRYGNNDALRYTADLSRVLIPKKLGIRVDLLDDEERYNQRPSFQTSRRAYGTLTYEPFPSTTIRGNFETGNTLANREITVLPYNDASSAWYAAGRPTYDASLYDDPSRFPAAATTVAGNNLPLTVGTSYVYGPLVSYNSPTGPISNVFYWRTLSAANTANNIGTSVYNSQVNKDSASDTFAFYNTLNVFNLPASYWTGANVPAGQQPGYAPAGIKAQSFTDYSAFDWQNQMLDETSREGDSFHTLNLSFSQTAWEDRIGIEVAYDRQRVDRWTKDSFLGANSNHVFIDINQVLPDGTPNPNVGRPFLSMNYPTWQNNFDDREGKRATAFLKYDFADLNKSWGKWLGHHTLTGLYEENAHDNVAYTYGLAAEGVAADASDAGANINSSYHRPDYIVYLGPSITGANSNNPLTLSPIKIQQFSAGAIPAMEYFSRAASPSDPGQYLRAPTTVVELNHGGLASREVIKSQAFVLQSYWLKDNVITTLGWRRDEDYYASKSIAYVQNPTDKSDPGQVHYGLDDFNFADTPPPSVSGETKSYGVVVRWPDNLINVKLPQGTDLSVFYNKAANFTAVGGRVGIYNAPLPPPKGNTKEYGVNISAFHDKLTIRLNHFETANSGVSSAPSFFSSAIKSMIITPLLAWYKEANTNAIMAPQSLADAKTLLSALPSNYLDLYQFKITGAAPTIFTEANTSAISPTDTVDYTAKGWETDITYNPTKHWRILANIANQETIQSNAYPGLKEFLARMTPAFTALRNRPLGNYPSDFVPGSTLPPSIQTYGQYLDTNFLVPFASALATEGVASAEQRKWRFNLVTNYSFGKDSFFDGALDGLGVGAAVRWQSELGLGYPSTRNPDGSVKFDIANPYYAPAQTNGDLWVSYTRKLKHNLTWTVQLNARNIIGSQDLVGMTVQAYSGQIAQYRLPAERRWYLTNTFGF